MILSEFIAKCREN